MSATPQSRFRQAVDYMISVYERLLKNMEKKKLVDVTKINSILMGSAKEAIKELTDKKLIESAIEKSYSAWVYAHYYTEDDRLENVTYLRNNFGVFLSELPEEILEELTRLALLTDEDGEYEIDDEVITLIHRAGLSMVKQALAYLEDNCSDDIESHTIRMPFKNRMIEYDSYICDYKKFSYIDIGFWRNLYPEVEAEGSDSDSE